RRFGDADDGHRRDLARRRQARIAEAGDDDTVELAGAIANYLQGGDGSDVILVVALDRARPPLGTDGLDLGVGARVAARRLADVVRHLLACVRVDDQDSHVSSLPAGTPSL